MENAAPVVGPDATIANLRILKLDGATTFLALRSRSCRILAMSQIVIVGQFDLEPDDAAAAAELMRVMMNATILEQGCLHYAYSRDLSEPNRFQLSELWENDASLSAHFLTDHMATYRAGMSKLRVRSRTVRRYDATNAVDL